MKYQDTWVNGNIEEKGIRDCEERYKIIKSFCDKLNKPFTVLDIGANMSYFGLRLIEDFNCTVMAFEFHQFEEREKIIKQNNTKNLMYLKRKVSLSDLDILNSFTHFDLILALSVLHHVSEPINKWIEKLKILGNNVIVEMALEDSKRTNIRYQYNTPKGEILGYGDSHLQENFKRPIILLNK
jgi:2-polyprenyl-3-methyl-5-hydroxy-6-metoxy-1,4-benzoquinol methylase